MRRAVEYDNRHIKVGYRYVVSAYVENAYQKLWTRYIRRWYDSEFRSWQQNEKLSDSQNACRKINIYDHSFPSRNSNKSRKLLSWMAWSNSSKNLIVVVNRWVGNKRMKGNDSDSIRVEINNHHCQNRTIDFMSYSFRHQKVKAVHKVELAGYIDIVVFSDKRSNCIDHMIITNK